MKIYIVVTDVVNDVMYSRKLLLHVWSYDFYDMTLSTGKQRRHMINFVSNEVNCIVYVAMATIAP